MSATDTAVFRPSPALWVLATVAFLAPVMGGQQVTEIRAQSEPLLADVFLGGGTFPLVARFLLGALVLGAYGLVLYRQRVVPTAEWRLGLGWLALLATLLTAATISDFRYVALRETLNWVIYAGAFGLAVAVGGRGPGLRMVIGAAGAGTALLATRGVLEYAAMMREEPSYRIFAGWINPNATAGMLLVGFFCLVGYALSQSETSEESSFDRLLRLGSLVMAGVVVLALALTQSRGGFLAFGVGVVSLAALLAIWCRPRVITLAIPLVLGVALSAGMVGLSRSAASTPGTAPGALARVTNVQQEQSVGFRQNLWQSAIQLAPEAPLGKGAGTFRYWSARSGLVEQTVTVHQTYLEMLVNGGVLAVVLLAGIAGWWLVLVSRGSRVQPPATLALKSCVIAAVLAAGAHGLVESNLVILGIGLTVFVIMGVGIQLSTDASSPEPLPAPIRYGIAGVGCLIPILLMATHAAAESTKVSFQTAIATRSTTPPADPVPGSFGDPEALYLKGLYLSPDPQTRLDLLRRAADAQPSTRHLRAAARAATEAGDPTLALALLERVFRYDPNNLRALWLKVEMQQAAGDAEGARTTAQSLVDTEQALSFRVRALPELVPLETVRARAFLAESATGSERETLLTGALPLLEQYRERTVPMVKRLATAGLDYGGENPESAREAMAQGQTIAQSLAELYRAAGDPTKANEASERAAMFGDALSELVGLGEK